MFLEATAEKRVAVAKVCKMSMYVVCVLHDIFTHLVPREGARIVPFREDTGVEVTFEKDTFQDEGFPVDLKVLLLLRQCKVVLDLLIIIIQFLTLFCRK